MRSEQQIFAKIIHVAASDEKIRAALITGSRAHPDSSKDIFQDFDTIYIVTQLETFINDRRWIDVFGERLILQLPDQMTIGDHSKFSFHYLMLFKDGNRIDLTLFPLNQLSEFILDSFTTVLLDKDDLFEKLSMSGNNNYLIKQPTEKQFQDCCNEFWWVSTYVAKGLWRKEIIYAKEMMEIYVRAMFLKIIEWHIGIQTNFTVSFGKAGRNIKSYLAPELYKKILSTYPDSKAENIWKALFLMAHLFNEIAQEIASSSKFNYNTEEANNVKQYLQQIHSMSEQTERRNT